MITPCELVLLLKEKLNKFPVPKKKIKTTEVFCETSHGKSKSDGLGGVIKSNTSCAVCGEWEVIRGAKEIFDFFNGNLVVKAAYEKANAESCFLLCIVRGNQWVPFNIPVS